MPSRPLVRAAMIGGLLLLIVIAVAALLRERDANPPVDFDPAAFAGGEPQLDAPYVATEHEVVRSMLELADVDSDDFVMDLGSGDGRILIAAAKEHGARGLGVDIDPARIRDSRYNARAAGVEDKVRFLQRDLFRTPVRDADVLTLYLTPEINRALRPRILAEMRPGSRVVSHAYDMGEWQHDERDRVGSANVYMWVVPADVEGRWTLQTPSGEAQLEFDQEFQDLSGTITRNGRSVPIAHGRVSGELVEFVADTGGGRLVFLGRVQDETIVPVSGGESAVSLPRASGWRAVSRS